VKDCYQGQLRILDIDSPLKKIVGVIHVYDTQFKKRKGHPPKTLRLDPVQLTWVEKYSARSGLNFSEIVRVAIAQPVESKVIDMGDFQKLLDRVAIQSHQVEEMALGHYAVRIAEGLVSPEREVVVKNLSVKTWRRNRVLNLRFKAVTRPLSPDGLASGAMKPIPLRSSPSEGLCVCPRIPKGHP